MRIKVTSLCYLTSKERHGLQKKYERIKEQKALVLKKEEKKRE